jgi:hypothetical protein
LLPQHVIEGKKGERRKWREEEDEDVRSYWMAFRKRADIGN